ncbi:MAG: hypothetical protein ABH934_00405 [Chloroflexota bacterium]
MMELICYCFGYTERDIIDDYIKNNGSSTILKRIAAAKKNNTCECEVKHPQKR